jgi:hypothetical protein
LMTCGCSALAADADRASRETIAKTLVNYDALIILRSAFGGHISGSSMVVKTAGRYLVMAGGTLS